LIWSAQHCTALHCTALHCTALHCLASGARAISRDDQIVGPIICRPAAGVCCRCVLSTRAALFYSSLNSPVLLPTDHSATRPLGHLATRPLGHSATRPLGHSATRPPGDSLGRNFDVSAGIQECSGGKMPVNTSQDISRSVGTTDSVVMVSQQMAGRPYSAGTEDICR
jgi:hypothetical protein